MKVVYCSRCGHPLPISRKAIPRYGQIIDIVPPHECSEELHDVELIPVSEIPKFNAKGDDTKFLQKLNDLNSISTSTFRDRRVEQSIDKRSDYQSQTSSAPVSVLDQLNSFKLQNTVPEHHLIEAKMDNEDE